ncbi:MAG: hypothetical protein IJ068_03695 [Bacilli bacterium]|nr:hypothetical protein [Bacilli bacterium]
MNDRTRRTLDQNFIDYFGMTLDQFSTLDIDTQEVLIRKVKKLRKKLLSIESKKTLKDRIAEFFLKKEDKIKSFKR